MGAVRTGVAVVIFMCVAVALGACARQQVHMWPVQNAAPLSAPETAAALVIIYPQSPLQSGPVTIVDGNGGFLGTAQPGTHYAVAIPPGEHLIISMGDDVRPLKVNVAAGRVYFVHAEPESGAAHVLNLWPVVPATARWNLVPQWLAETKPFAPDIGRGQPSVQKRGAEILNYVNRAQQMLAMYDPPTLAGRTLAAEYGLVGPVQVGTPLPAPTPLPGAEPPPAPEPEAPPEPVGTFLGPLHFENMKVVSADEASGAKLEVIEAGTVTSAQGVAVKFQAEEANFGEAFAGYTYDTAGIDQLAAGDAIALFVPGIKYRRIAMPEQPDREEYEDQEGALVLAPEKWGEGRLNGAWIQVSIASVKSGDTGVTIRVNGRFRSNRGAIHQNLELVRGDSGYTLKPLIQVKPAAYDVADIALDRAKRKIGIFKLEGENFAPTTEGACDTDASIVEVTEAELKTEGTVAQVDGKPQVFCPGAAHKWVGTLEYGGYRIRSHADDPLRFRLDPKLGYVFAGGRGSVTLPDGKIVNLR